MEVFGMTGERLGTIGGANPAKEDLPQWKRDFLSKPSLSLRKGIAWKYNPPTEPTSTLVLTSHSNKFIDIRFPVQPKPSQPLSSDPSFWAFSGTSTTTFDPETEGVLPMPYAAHSVWKHDIDTMGSGITDEGDMFVLQNGDCMEVGMMKNPASGEVEMYREYWTQPVAEPGSGGLKKSPCVVAEGVGASEDGIKGKGLIIRIGDHCQGIAQMSEGGEVLAERWVKSPAEVNPAVSNDHLEDASWLRDWRSNTESAEQVDVVIPCMWACGEGRRLGDEILARGLKWKITELAR